MDLLPAGEAFLGHARKILAAVEEARAAIAWPHHETAPEGD